MVMNTNGLTAGCFPEELTKVLRSVAAEWGEVDIIDELEGIQVIRLTGAMTNEVFLIKWPARNGGSSRKVVVRVYGEGVEIFFNRDEEIRTFVCLSNHGHGPRLLGQFADGRVEEFIHARTLSAADLRDPETAVLIAGKLREFHGLDMPGPKTACLWDKMRSWLLVAKSLCSPKDAKEFSLDALDAEIKMLQRELPSEDQEIGFCHNDLQYGNIMISEETRSITVIDYEYASYNPVAYDLANHFCEMTANYHSETPHILDFSKYPGPEERRRFVQAYLSSSGIKPSEAEVRQLVEDAERYTLANHLFWCLWGIISSYVNKIDFDYKEYAKQRLCQYWLRKPKILGYARISCDGNTGNRNGFVYCKP